jgi:drug/metabolite transporter (DMT)-like permease
LNPLSKPVNQKAGYLALCITCIVWGTTWVVSKIGVNYLPPFQMAAMRQGIAGVLLVLFFAGYRRMPLPGFRQFVRIAGMALLMFVGANGLSTWSLKFIPTGLSSLIGALYPLTVVVAERLFFGSRSMNLLTFTGMMLGIGGVAIVFYENIFHHPGPGFFFGVGLSLAAMLSWSIGTIVIARRKSTVDPFHAIGWQMLLSAVMLGIISAVRENPLPVAAIPLKGWLSVLYLVIAGSLISFAAFIYSMKTLPAALFSLYAYINPLVAMLTGALLLGEKLTPYIFWGSVVTLAGVFLVNYSVRNQEPALNDKSER